MKTMNYASTAQSTKKKPTEKYDLVFLSGSTGSTSTWTFWSGRI